MTVADTGRPPSLASLAAAFPVLFPAATESAPHLLVIGPCDRIPEPEMEPEI